MGSHCSAREDVLLPWLMPDVDMPFGQNSTASTQSRVLDNSRGSNQLPALPGQALAGFTQPGLGQPGLLENGQVTFGMLDGLSQGPP